MRPLRILAPAAAVFSATGYALYRGVLAGAIAAPGSIGPRRRDLGPLQVRIAAPPQVVFDVIADPYLKRGTHLVYAGHLGAGLWSLGACSAGAECGCCGGERVETSVA